jgi:hypothetical protein
VSYCLCYTTKDTKSTKGSENGTQKSNFVLFVSFVVTLYCSSTPNEQAHLLGRLQWCEPRLLYACTNCLKPP